MVETDGIFAVRLGVSHDVPERAARFDVGGRFWMPWHESPFPEGAAHAMVLADAWPMPWQLPDWQRMLRRAGAVDATWAVYELCDGALTSFACFEVRRVGLGLSGWFCVGGPVGTPVVGKDLARACRALAADEDAAFVQVEPARESGLFAAGKWRLGAHKRFLEPCTAWVDLSRGETDILAGMREKGRYNVRLSAKHDVEALPVEASDAHLDEFMRLLAETTGRDGFSGNSRAHYRALLDFLDERGWGGLFFARKGGEVLAAGIFSFVGGVATYYYGASTSDNAKRKFMPAYALQWRAMLEGKRRGCAVFDFLGIDDPLSEAPGHLEGVTDFKLKFGPEIRRWPQAHVYVARPWAYRALRSVRWVKKLLGK